MSASEAESRPETNIEEYKGKVAGNICNSLQVQLVSGNYAFEIILILDNLSLKAFIISCL